MENIIKKWRDNNKDKVKLQKKRERVRSILRKNNILPNNDVTPNKEQQIILDQISNNDFSYYEKFKEEKHRQTNSYKKRIHTEEEQPILKKERLLYESRKYGILPKVGEPLNEEQQEIYNFIYEHYETPIKSFLSKYSNLTTPEHRIWYRAKKSSYRKKYKHDFNISVEDIVIPKVCPYLGIPLSTEINDINKPNYYSIDRIDSTKGYVKDNIQIISKLANTMKNNATIDELIIFSRNVLKIHDVNS
jgi:hypothetical protein